MECYCKYCNQKYKSMTDSYHHICMAIKTNWDNPKASDRELRFLKSTLILHPR